MTRDTLVNRMFWIFNTRKGNAIGWLMMKKIAKQTFARNKFARNIAANSIVFFFTKSESVLISTTTEETTFSVCGLVEPFLLSPLASMPCGAG